MSGDTITLPTLPWRLTLLTELSQGSYQANICDGEHVAIGTGSTMQMAIIAAGYRAIDGDYAGRLFHLTPFREPTLNLQSLMRNLIPPKPTITRRI